jgi:hypothetical protein
VLSFVLLALRWMFSEFLLVTLAALGLLWLASHQHWLPIH